MRTALPATMHAAVLTGFGGPDKLVYRDDVPLPIPQTGEVLVRVGASAVNNTDINTRVGWYSKTVDSATAADSVGFNASADATPGWGGTAMQFPRIQGADCCGTIVAVGPGVDAQRVGQRVLVRPVLRMYAAYAPFACWYLGSECDGAFAQYTKVPADAALPIHSSLGDAELATFPCAYSTAENLLTRSGVRAGDRVLVTGASGGVGSAAVQLALRRGAQVVAQAAPDKQAALLELGAEAAIDRGADALQSLGRNAVSVVIDLVGGAQWPLLLDALRTGGRYASAGAIAGPVVPLDLRTLYLKDLSLFGCTFQDDAIFEDLVSYIERGEVRPLLAQTYALSDIAQAQADFSAKQFLGKLALVPPQ
jgi:NADPH:quinone reductase-like Zn-dependent oxidoreductase